MNRRIAATGIALLVLASALLFTIPREDRVERRFGEVIHETRSEFSHILVREKGDTRSLLFVDEDGAEQCQSSVDLAHPAELQLGYTRTLFATLLFHYPQERVLIVGLGGGGMVRFLNDALPEIRVEAVEIDPAVVQIAADYFETRNGSNMTIHTADAFQFFTEDHGPYDVVYMDAFLRPGAEFEGGDKTQRLKTVSFLREIRSRLQPDGLLAFNLIETDPVTTENLSAIREVFPSVYEFSVPGTGNLVVIASQDEQRLARKELLSHAEERKILEIGIPFLSLIDHLRE